MVIFHSYVKLPEGMFGSVKGSCSRWFPWISPLKGADVGCPDFHAFFDRKRPTDRRCSTCRFDVYFKLQVTVTILFPLKDEGFLKQILQVSLGQVGFAWGSIIMGQIHPARHQSPAGPICCARHEGPLRRSWGSSVSQMLGRSSGAVLKEDPWRPLKLKTHRFHTYILAPAIDLVSSLVFRLACWVCPQTPASSSFDDLLEQGILQLLHCVLRTKVETAESATLERLFCGSVGWHDVLKPSSCRWCGPAPTPAVTNSGRSFPWSNQNFGWTRFSGWNRAPSRTCTASMAWFATVACTMWHYSGVQPERSGSSSMTCVWKKRRTGLRSWI